MKDTLCWLNLKWREDVASEEPAFVSLGKIIVAPPRPSVPTSGLLANRPERFMVQAL
jgi:hypothetical protein